MGVVGPNKLIDKPGNYPMQGYTNCWRINRCTLQAFFADLDMGKNLFKFIFHCGRGELYFFGWKSEHSVMVRNLFGSPAMVISGHVIVVKKDNQKIRMLTQASSAFYGIGDIKPVERHLKTIIGGLGASVACEVELF